MMSSSARESGTISTYQRYKLGQAQFQKWLKQASDKLRLASTELVNPSENKNNKKGPNKPVKGSQSKSNPNTASAVHWSQLESMAVTIIDKSDPEQIPESAIKILRDVVHLRKKSAQFFRSAAAKSDDDKLKQKNVTHEHIIKVLENILDRFNKALLKLRRSPAESSSHQKEAQETDRLGMGDINNMFEYLRVEETPDGDWEIADTLSDTEGASKSSKKLHKKNGKKGGKKPKKQPKQSRASKNTTSTGPSWVDTFRWTDDDEDEEEDEFDYYMLIYCYFQDFNSIRTYVEDRWMEYFYHNSVPLETLAVITNAACELFHGMEHDLQKTVKDTPELAEYSIMLKTLFFDYGLDHVDYEGEDQLTEFDRNFKILGEADWLGFFAFTGVQKLLEFIPPGKVPMFPPSEIKSPQYGLLTPDDYQQFVRDIVTELATECCLFKAMKTNSLIPMVLSAQDELSLDLEHMFRVRDYDSALIFGLSMYIDIRYMMEDRITDHFNHLQATAARVKATLENELPKIKGLGYIKKECRNRIGEIEQLIIEDFVEEDKSRRLAEKNITEPIEKHFLLKRDPVWSGLLAFRCKVGLNSIGHRFANESTLVLGAAFLYVASQLSSSNSAPDLHWPAMDHLFQALGEFRVLGGVVTPGMTPPDLLQKFVISNLATQHSRTEFFSPSRSLEALYKRYGGNADPHLRSSRAPYHQEIVRERLGSRSKNPASSDPTRRSVRVTEAEAALLARVSPVQLLEVLDETTTSLLENELAIDYFGLHHQSVRLFRALLKEFAAEVKADREAAGAGLLALGEEEVDLGKVSKLALMVPVVYRAWVEGNAGEVARRLGKVVAGFCEALR